MSGAGDLQNELAVFRVLAERTLRQEYLQLEFHNHIQRHPISDCFLWFFVAAFHDVDLRASGRSILLLWSTYLREDVSAIDLGTFTNLNASLNRLSSMAKGIC